MIAFLRGTVIGKEQQSIVVSVCDIGYRVFVTEASNRAMRIDDEVALHIHHHVREQGIELYGFALRDDIAVFEQLISISGIGPKSALSILTVCSAEKLRRAVDKGDAQVLRQVSGIGMKTAERIIVELRGKFTVSGIEGNAENADGEIIEALVSLGYSPMAARTAVNALSSSLDGVEVRLKAALKILSSVA